MFGIAKKSKFTKLCKEMDVSYQNLEGINCPLATTLESEEKTDEERQAAQRKKDETREVIRNVVFSLVKDLIASEPIRRYGIVIADDLYQWYSKHVVLYDAFTRLNQSDCPAWFEARKCRISASRAHSVKTRKGNFDTLVANLMKDNKFKSAATTYSIRMEKLAFTIYSSMAQQRDFTLFKMGVIVKKSQPWLCCSPDGIAVGPGGNPKRMLEIKCPYSCKTKPPISFESHTSNLPYLQIPENNNIEIKESHAYYTQIQMQL